MGYLLTMRSVIILGLLLTGCDGLRAWVVRHWPQEYTATTAPDTPAAGTAQAASHWPSGVPFTDGPDLKLPSMSVALELVADGLREPTDIQFAPGSSTQMLVLEKSGQAVWIDLADQSRVEVITLSVPSKSEQGLLGAAFHPDFADNGWLFLNHSHAKGGQRSSRVVRVQLDPQTRRASTPQLVMEVAQPYGNHNAGQLAFGPDGMLYIGWGDGGWRADPHGHGQNARSLLGSMLRIDVDRQDPGKAYGVPPDNPWVDSSGVAPEAWAIGLRNPWRYSFGPQGQLIVADVGQDAWEEVSVVAKGDNLGWNIREGTHCFEPSEGCASQGLRPPVHEYSHESGESITGGYVYTGSAVPELKGRYVFGDFVSGRIWAITVPTSGQGMASEHTSLGRWTMLPSTFGQDASGELYVADYGRGRIFRFTAADQTSGSR